MGQIGRRQFLVVATMLVAVAPLGLRAQPGVRTARVGLLFAGTPSIVASYFEGVRSELRALGWEEGRNLVFEKRYAEGHADRFPALAAQLVGAGVDVIVASTSQAVDATRAATRSVPIVMLGVPDPIAQGYVASYSRPGGNVTGLSNMQSREIPLKQLELALELLPGSKTMGILWSPENKGSADAFAYEQSKAEKSGLRVVSLAVSTPEQIDGALELALRERIQFLRVHATPAILVTIGEVASWGAQHRVPTIGGLRAYAQAGVLASYNPDYLDMWRGAARFVDRILRGAKPAEMPIERPTKFLLVVNQKTAQRIGITIPQSVLARADEVIQ